MTPLLANRTITESMRLNFLLVLRPTGEGVVPEQEDEVEASERRSAGSSCSRERTGEREEGNAAAVRVLRHRSPPPLDGLLSQRGQS